MTGAPRHRGLTADMFLIRRETFLTLRRVGGLGAGFEYIPGGVVEPGEDPMDAAVRETTEECGLHPRDVSLLRVWTYPTPEGHETVHATYVGYCDEGDVQLSAEHDGSRWVTADAYVERWVSPGLDDTFPDYAVLFQQIRRNCDLVREFLVRRSV